MKRHLLLFLVTALLPVTQPHAKKIKVACVGNSITYGAFINDRERWHYPAQLQSYLGDDYEVRNFGVNGTTMLHSGDYPYIQTDQYRQAQEFQPDIVLIKLGTNDTKGWNWKHRADYQADYQTFIDTFRALPSHPRLILLTPLRCFIPADDPGISSQTIAAEVRPMVEDLAYRNQLEIINMFNVVPDTWDPTLMPDKLHPSARGAGLMALKIYKHLTVTPEAAPRGAAAEPFYRHGATPFNFHGFTGYDFQISGVACKVVEPRVVAQGRPWVWRARFWGHEPQTDIDLLERGFHVAYCDVADLYGSPAAVRRWDAFYKQMIRAGFARRVALEGLSRGGLIIYNWAARHPRQVACIYADAPVMDFKQWPMSLPGNAGDTQKLLLAYGFASEDEARAWKGNPLDHASTMARARIPILHVVGDADEGVLYSLNTKIFEEKMRALGAPIQVIHKPAMGHHPHSLSCPQPIVDFILQAVERD
ncbi:MAG: prolyl oligopeptidase family serine peptidase [Bacteroidaceae bacterium]|nr:prolyl oligopeptidase family serine peptidase [Bacteroidaceae bacterium]